MTNVIGPVAVEWHEDKRLWTLALRGVDFDEVRVVFVDEQRLEWEDVRRNYGERRWNILCPVNDRLMQVTYTLRVNVDESYRHDGRMRGSKGFMSKNGRIERVVYLDDGQVMIERSDGTRRPLEGKTDWTKVDAQTDEDIAQQIAEDPEDPANDPDYPDDPVKFRIVYPPPKERITVRLDKDVLDWLRAQGAGYQTRMNAILRGYMEHARKGGE